MCSHRVRRRCVSCSQLRPRQQRTYCYGKPCASRYRSSRPPCRSLRRCPSSPRRQSRSSSLFLCSSPPRLPPRSSPPRRASVFCPPPSCRARRRSRQASSSSTLSRPSSRVKRSSMPLASSTSRAPRLATRRPTSSRAISRRSHAQPHAQPSPYWRHSSMRQRRAARLAARGALRCSSWRRRRCNCSVGCQVWSPRPRRPPITRRGLVERWLPSMRSADLCCKMPSGELACRSLRSSTRA
mmetsp:Transcript_76044/g.150675  ORF Transcript_76044/g.150675 Transcript_76044/m.150675 type:complete len:240 (-) Transcript_76044:255-974(-)